VLISLTIKKPDNTPFSEIEKTVIFLHSAVSFEIDQKIKDNALTSRKRGKARKSYRIMDKAGSLYQFERIRQRYLITAAQSRVMDEKLKFSLPLV